MKLAALVFSVLMAMAPLVASAELDLRIGPNTGADQVDAVVAPGSGEHFFDLTFSATGINETFNEYLVAYDLGLVTARPGLRLLRVEKPDNWVFTDAAATLITREADAGRILAEGAEFGGADYGSDVTTGTEAARVFYSVDPDVTPGLYQIALSPNWTAFGTGNPNGHEVFVDFNDPGMVLVTPEPSGFALLGLAGVLALRRRR